MNTGQLKRFAQEARRKLIQQVGAKLDFVLTTDSAELREKTQQVKQLREALDAFTKEQMVEKVSYTWFNRLMALRFMDANDYQPLGIRVITPKDDYTTPELLDEAKRGSIPADLKVNQQRVYDLLDGKIPSTNPQNEAFKELLIAACNHLHTTFPFLFEKIDDYTELLLPDDLTSDFSIVTDMRNGMPVDDCRNVEIIGWIYQFYISEKKDEVFASKAKVKKEDIPAATQLFTPRWIVEYMVQNTVGKLWLQNRPNSKLREHMPYFIESESLKADDYLKIGSPEEIRLADPASGSGHILVYAFDLFTKIYEEEGYNTTDIPKLIIEKNLYGFEIDERAAQLSGLALMMKAREYHRRAFRRDIKPNILCYEDLKLNVYPVDGFEGTFKVKKDSALLEQVLSYGYNIAEDIIETKIEEHTDKDTGEAIEVEIKKKIIPKGGKTVEDFIVPISLYGNNEITFYQDDIKDVFRQLSLPLSFFLYTDLLLIKQATNYGSLILPKTDTKEIETTIEQLTQKSKNTNIFLKPKTDALLVALSQLLTLAQKFHCVVANPPYMGGGNMNPTLSEFVKKYYPDSKADLMACFMESGLAMLHPIGFLGMINQHSWMFLSSYEILRKKLIENVSFDTMLHLGARTFPEISGEVVQNTSFTFFNRKPIGKGVYIRLIDFEKSELKRIKTIEAINVWVIGWLSKTAQKDFERISGSPIAYWLKKEALEVFANSPELKSVAQPRQGLATTNNDLFLRQWFEIPKLRIGFNLNKQEAEISGLKWFPLNKGGTFRRWYGNNNFVINFEQNGRTICEYIDNTPNVKVKSNGRVINRDRYFTEGITWSTISSDSLAMRYSPIGSIFETKGAMCFCNDKKLLMSVLGYMNTKVVAYFLKAISPTLDYHEGPIGRLPIIINNKSIALSIIDTVKQLINDSKFEWDSKENSWDFIQNELLRIKGQDLEESYDLYQQYWKNKFFQLHQNEEELNHQFIEIYGLQDELTPDVPLEDITILQDELDRKALAKLNKKLVRNPQTLAVTNYHEIELPFIASEVLEQFISYAVGCMFGRYSLDKEGLILANQGETLQDYLKIIGAEKSPSGDALSVSKWDLGVTFLPDDDNIIPILDSEWFEDDIVGRFYTFLKVTFGEKNFNKNLAFIEEQIGMDMRRYFTKNFYPDHVQRYKKRPIYWMFSSPKGSFNALIYMHRYTPDTVSNILNKYLKEFIGKLKSRKEHLQHIQVSGSPAEKTKAIKESDAIDKMLVELHEYERDTLYPLATQRIAIDLDDGVLVNYNKFGKAIKEIAGLNDKKAKDKVRKFDWIDVSEIR
jgi:type II restriction/modification system DNA methylase subunit YeeA